jgi:uncharacterized protein (TIGR03382 family)
MRLTLQLTALAIPFFAATGALAQDIPCTSDADCGEGQICALTDCAQPCDTDVDPNCEPTDCGTGVTCIDIGEPPPPNCTADADCAEGERCITETFETCVDTGCACPDGDPACECPPPPPEGECATETFSYCAPPWAAACDADADCGAGFTCELLEVCACSGGGGSEGAPDADPAAPPAEECVCETATEGSCVLERVECESAADCLEGFECVDEGSAGTCSVSEDGTVSCDEPAASASICVPPAFTNGPEAESGLVRAEDAGSDDEDNLGDDVDAQNIIINCSASSPAGALPLAALLLLLRRRRR